ncbi:MAG: hypothetical protein U1A27_12625 [Phycisphaerae bacterium]
MKAALRSPKLWCAAAFLLTLTGCDEGDFSTGDIISIINAVADAVIAILHAVG